MKRIITTAIMVFGMYSLQAQITDDFLIQEAYQLQNFKDEIPDSTYKWYWGVGYNDDESIADAMRKAEIDNPPKEGEMQVMNYIIYNVTLVRFDENRKYIYYNKVGLKK
jgi:hypothetical protein